MRLFPDVITQLQREHQWRCGAIYTSVTRSAPSGPSRSWAVYGWQKRSSALGIRTSQGFPRRRRSRRDPEHSASVLHSPFCVPVGIVPQWRAIHPRDRHAGCDVCGQPQPSVVGLSRVQSTVWATPVVLLSKSGYAGPDDGVQVNGSVRQLGHSPVSLTACHHPLRHSQHRSQATSRRSGRDWALGG
jgi:hypothetical protein